jgi:hypothetical protein
VGFIIQLFEKAGTAEVLPKKNRVSQDKKIG